MLGGWADLEPSLLARTLRSFAVSMNFTPTVCRAPCRPGVGQEALEGRTLLLLGSQASLWEPAVWRSPDPGISLLLQLIQRKSNHFKVYDYNGVCTFIILGTCRLCSFKLFKHPPKGDPTPISSHSLYPSAPGSWPPPICFLHLWIYLIWTFHIDSISQYEACLYLASSTQHVFKASSRVSVYPASTPQFSENHTLTVPWTVTYPQLSVDLDLCPMPSTGGGDMTRLVNERISSARLDNWFRDG